MSWKAISKKKLSPAFRENFGHLWKKSKMSNLSYIIAKENADIIIAALKDIDKRLIKHQTEEEFVMEMAKFIEQSHKEKREKGLEEVFVETLPKNINLLVQNLLDLASTNGKDLCEKAVQSYELLTKTAKEFETYLSYVTPLEKLQNSIDTILPVK